MSLSLPGWRGGMEYFVSIESPVCTPDFTMSARTGPGTNAQAIARGFRSINFETWCENIFVFPVAANTFGCAGDRSGGRSATGRRILLVGAEFARFKLQVRLRPGWV
jgi:hypothetical protein